MVYLLHGRIVLPKRIAQALCNFRESEFMSIHY